MIWPPNTRVQRNRSSPSPLRSPLTRRPLGGLAVVVLIALNASAVSVAKGEESIIEAHRLAYCGPNVETTIYASGFAHQRVLDTCQDVDRSQLLRLTKAQIEAITGAIAAAKLCGLPSH